MNTESFDDVAYEVTGGGEAYHKLLDKHNEDLEAVSEKKGEEKAVKKFNSIKAEYRIQAFKEYEEMNTAQKVAIISSASPFISETVMKNGQELNRSMIFSTAPINDPVSEEVKLHFDDINYKWLIRKNNGLPKLVSRFFVEAALIVDAYAPGSCRAIVVFLRGGLKPLIFWGGNIEPAAVRIQTQFHQKGLTVRNRDFYHESFLRALCMCPNVFFLTMPKHCGWNTTPDGRRVFVSSENMLPVLADLFYDVKE